MRAPHLGAGPASLKLRIDVSEQTILAHGGRRNPPLRITLRPWVPAARYPGLECYPGGTVKNTDSLHAGILVVNIDQIVFIRIRPYISH